MIKKPAPSPFTVTDDVISQHIIGIHDSQATRHNVDFLYNVVTNIVKNSTHIGDSLDLKRTKSIELVEDKVPQSSFLPSYPLVKEIACQMTCKHFSASTAHETVVGILEKLRSYTWDAKAVIALTAFALDYGETWRFSLMQAHKENALELHVFRFREEEKPYQDKDIISTLVDRTLQLIEGITKLEKLIANKTYSQKDVPALFKAPRDLYTYWAILVLVACSNRMSELEWNIKSEVVTRLVRVLSQLNAYLDETNRQIEKIEDLTWRFAVFQTPSGILELLKALIFPKNVKQLEIFDNSAKELVNPEVLKTKNLLLFISGLDNIQDEISVLKSVHDSLTKDKDKQDYKILWIPVVEKWNKEEKEKFENLKSQMPWYAVHYFSLIKGFKSLQEEWNYQGKPIVVVTNPRGEVINKNAMHLIFVWKEQAFPFRHEDEERLTQHWKWFWIEAFKINSDITKWVTEENKYIFFYGGTDSTWTQKFGNLVDNIKKDSIIKEANTFIEQFNLGKIDRTTESKFWVNICNSFLSKIQRDHYELDSVLKDIQTLLSMKSEKGWALLSKGEKVLVLGYNDLMMVVVEGFDDWKKNVKLQGVDKAFIEHYNSKRSPLPLHCRHFQLNNIRSGVPSTIYCPDPSCEMKMEIDSVNYECCHGLHYDHVTESTGEAHSQVQKANEYPDQSALKNQDEAHSDQSALNQRAQAHSQVQKTNEHSDESSSMNQGAQAHSQVQKTNEHSDESSSMNQGDQDHSPSTEDK